MYNASDVFSSAIGAVGIVFALIIAFIALFGVVIYLVARVKMFKKCGKEGWKAIIPFYTDYVQYVEISGLHWAWFLATIVIDLIAVSNTLVLLLKMFVNGMSFYNIAIRCKKDPIPSMIFGGIFPGILVCVYGFSTIYYDENIIVRSSGLF